MNKIRKDLEKLEFNLRLNVEKIGIHKTVELTGLKYTDIQAWLKGRRRWSFEKILNISDKIK